MAPSNPTDHGAIITFYSYKGGTGRSMALANYACFLARRQDLLGKRILIVDWDLEAPGLHRYFPKMAGFPNGEGPKGVIEYFGDLRKALIDDKDLYSRVTGQDGLTHLDLCCPLGNYLVRDVFTGSAAVDLMRAGLLGPRYSGSVAAFPWAEFFNAYSLAFRTIRELIATRYAFCLIDSRTGLTDTSGICTMLMPEKLVAVFTPNTQSLDGVVSLLKESLAYRAASNDFRPLAIFPLPSRIENVQKLQEQWRERYQNAFETLFTVEGAGEKPDLTEYFNRVLLPHKGDYAFGERIAVIEEKFSESGSLRHAYEACFEILSTYEVPWEQPERGYYLTPDSRMSLFYRIAAGLHKKILWGLALIICFLLVRSTTLFDRAYYSIEETDPTRGAATVSSDILGDQFKAVKYLNQGWTPADSLWFYTTTQGSDLLPYDFFIALEQAKSQEPFRSPENMNRYRYLPQKATHSNPDALPVGMVADSYLGKKYMGFTCAACHSSQVNYKGVGIRIDGGPGAADMDTFMIDLADSLAATSKDPAKQQRFVAAVLKAGNYNDENTVVADLKTYALRTQAYNFFNESTLNGVPVSYGYARLDAFGRIFNRVAEHLLNPDALQAALADALPPDQMAALVAKMSPVITGEERDHLMDRLLNVLTKSDLVVLRDHVFNRPNAPASYPFLWDIPQHDYVQWNGIGANAGVGPLGRNTGEVIGVFATLDWSQKKDWTISSVIGGQGFGKTHINFQSSADFHNLRALEDRLWSLESPLWTDAVNSAGLPPIDPQRSARGEGVFAKYCASCHAVIDRTSPDRRVVAHMDKIVGGVATDPRMANNAVDDTGYSGVLRNLYSKTSVGDILLDTKAPVAALLTTATENVVATPDPDRWFFTRAADWATNLVKVYFSNKIKPSVKSGNYTPDSTSDPYASLRSYKGRPLNGIWATAPYLHNGSVPTLYDLLLPADPIKGDAPGTVYRPKKFMVGSRELDVIKVGFRSGEKDYQGFLFDTSQPANSNSGHEYGTRQMTDQDRWDLVEYLKNL